MPNWCEGSLKLKGDPKNIRKFLAERILYTDVKDVPEDTIKDSRVDEHGVSVDVVGWRWIKGTVRSFLLPQYIEYTHEEVLNLDIAQAWGFDYDDWITMAQTYDLQIKLYGVEQGMMYTHYIFIKDGKIEEEKTDMYDKYEDWLWNVPFPNMGG